MNVKNKLIVFFIFVSIITLSILNVKNPEKTKFYLFTSKTEEISLGNLITLTFLSGLTLSSILTFILNNNLKESFNDKYIDDEKIDKSEENTFSEVFESDRPPERDVRESQPTISVNYRFIDQDNNFYNSKNKKNNLNNDDNDWLNNENEW
tara:strand:- start:1101 stop:1553 length:453 start_codon:yes stop_codon:yes gene_type:complete